MSALYLIAHANITAFPAINNQRFQCFIRGSPPGDRTITHQVLLRVNPKGMHMQWSVLFIISCALAPNVLIVVRMNSLILSCVCTCANVLLLVVCMEFALNRSEPTFTMESDVTSDVISSELSSRVKCIYSSYCEIYTKPFR